MYLEFPLIYWKKTIFKTSKREYLTKIKCVLKFQKEGGERMVKAKKATKKAKKTAKKSKKCK